MLRIIALLVVATTVYSMLSMSKNLYIVNKNGEITVEKSNANAEGMSNKLDKKIFRNPIFDIKDFLMTQEAEQKALIERSRIVHKESLMHFGVMRIKARSAEPRVKFQPGKIKLGRADKEVVFEPLRQVNPSFSDDLGW